MNWPILCTDPESLSKGNVRKTKVNVKLHSADSHPIAAWLADCSSCFDCPDIEILQQRAECVSGAVISDKGVNLRDVADAHGRDALVLAGIDGENNVSCIFNGMA